MATRKVRKNGNGKTGTVTDYRHDGATRVNIPPAKIAAEGTIPRVQEARYSYSPRRAPSLRFDPTGGADKLMDLLGAARHRALSGDEAKALTEALRTHEPWLEWTGKREAKTFEVDPVALMIHERISTQAILRVAARQDVQRDLFADPQMAYHEAVQFYRHDMDWTNRMILGDSLQVMSSLARREDLAGKVQMIYMDPPYGIKFASNFQPEIGKRDVKDKEQDLTREPEMVKAYRDTWTLGIHSYLAYLRDRLLVARDLLADTGSIFVQINDENLHRVRCVMDDVFGGDNFIVTIVVKKKGATTPTDPVNDYLLWYAKHIDLVRVRQLTAERGEPEDDPKFNTLLSPDGEHRRAKDVQSGALNRLVQGDWEWVRANYPIVSQHPHDTRSSDYVFRGNMKKCGANKQWRFEVPEGLKRLESAESV
jgi:adenine-specific DNA-methyltransferase